MKPTTEPASALISEPDLAKAVGAAGLRSAGEAENTGDFTPSDWFLFFAISLIWGASFLLIAISLGGLTTGMTTLLRVGFGAVTLWVIRLSGRNGSAIQRADWPHVFLLAFVWVAVPFTLFPLAQQHINSAITGLLNGATPVFVAIVSVLLTRVVPRGPQMAGIVMGLVGLVTLSWPSINDGDSQAGGVAMVLAATVCYGFAINLAGPLLSRYGAITLMSWVLALASVALIPVGLRDFGRNEWTWGSLVAVTVLGVVGTGLAYWTMATLVGRVGSIRASFITYLIPVVSLVLGVVFRSDDVAALALAGAAITTAGALLASRRQAQPAVME